MAERTDLLQVITLSDQHQKKFHGVPLLMEFPVNPELAPYLVSSTRGVLWVHKALSGKVRAAVRDVKIESLYGEIVLAVSSTGSTARWGNVHPLTADGIESAAEHLRSYGLEQWEILGHPDTREKVERASRSLIEVPWAPPGHAVLVPVDRSFVGFVIDLDDRIVSVVHNPSRGMAVVRSPE